MVAICLVYIFLFIPYVNLVFPSLTWIGFIILFSYHRKLIRGFLADQNFFWFCGSYIFLMLFQFILVPNISDSTPANNFRHNLPIDYRIPLMLAEAIRAGELLTFGDWLGSDRPPLLTGFILVFSPPISPLSATYMPIGTGIQLLIIPTFISIMALILRTNRIPLAAFIVLM